MSNDVVCDFCGKGSRVVALVVVSRENGPAICSGCIHECVGVLIENLAGKVEAAPGATPQTPSHHHQMREAGE